jgi:hypothetical protein
MKHENTENPRKTTENRRKLADDQIWPKIRIVVISHQPLSVISHQSSPSGISSPPWVLNPRTGEKNRPDIGVWDTVVQTMTAKKFLEENKS